MNRDFFSKTFMYGMYVCVSSGDRRRRRRHGRRRHRWRNSLRIGPDTIWLKENESERKKEGET